MISLIFSSFLGMASALSGIGAIQATVKKYNEAPGVKMTVKKTVKLSLLDETKISEGQLYFSKGSLRLELAKPEDSLVVLNKSAIWVETAAEGLESTGRHVMKITSKDFKKRSKAPLANLLTDTKAWTIFKVLKETKKDQSIELQLEPRDKSKYPEMTKVFVSLNSENKEIQKLSYQDEIENEVTFEFSNIDLGKKIDKAKFNYKAPKGAEVVVY